MLVIGSNHRIQENNQNLSSCFCLDVELVFSVIKHCNWFPDTDTTMFKTLSNSESLFCYLRSTPSLTWKQLHRKLSFQVGTGAGKNASGSRGNGLRIGTGRATRTSTTTMQPPEEPHTYAAPTSSSGMRHLNVGIVVPYKSFGVREYTKATTSAKYNLARKLKLFKKFDIQVRIVMKEMTPSPTGE